MRHPACRGSAYCVSDKYVRHKPARTAQVLELRQNVRGCEAVRLGHYPAAQPWRWLAVSGGASLAARLCRYPRALLAWGLPKTTSRFAGPARRAAASRRPAEPRHSWLSWHWPSGRRAAAPHGRLCLLHWRPCPTPPTTMSFVQQQHAVGYLRLQTPHTQQSHSLSGLPPRIVLAARRSTCVSTTMSDSDGGSAPPSGDRMEISGRLSVSCCFAACSRALSSGSGALS